VLIAGLGQQKHTWPEDIAVTLAERGYRVIRFDNRDVGRSTHASFPKPNPVAILRGGLAVANRHHVDGAGRPMRGAPVVDMIEVSVRTRPGWCAATVWAIIPPIEMPKTCAELSPAASMTAAASSARSPMR
ncbi:MAG TPA: hypothetical protein VIH41_04305, partial [Myxococcales bacterium]